jgi:predicted nucleic acid-binding protein
MRLVIDASAALAAFTSQDRGASVVGSHDLLAPALLWSEFTSELHAALRRGEITPGTATSALMALDEMNIHRVDERRLHREAWNLAERLGWGRTYDAEYVALAIAESLPLLTLDARLARGIAQLVKVVSPADLAR